MGIEKPPYPNTSSHYNKFLQICQEDSTTGFMFSHLHNIYAKQARTLAVFLTNVPVLKRSVRSKKQKTSDTGKNGIGSLFLLGECRRFLRDQSSRSSVSSADSVSSAISASSSKFASSSKRSSSSSAIGSV